MRKFSFVAYDHHGKVIGLLENRPNHTVTTVWIDGKPTYVNSKDIARIEVFNLQAINKNKNI